MREDMRVVFRGEFDTADIKTGARETDSILSGLANKVQSLAIGAVIAKGFQLAYKACMECVGAFKEAQVAVTKFDSIAKSAGFTTKQIMNLKDYAGEVQNLTGMSDEAILGAEQLLVATNALDEEGIKKATLSCADLAVAMGTDITSSAQALAIALQSPTDGLTRLRRSGILFTDEEENLVKALDEAGEKAKAQELILAKIEARYKGVAKAVGDTDVGTLSKISETWGDIKENLGQAILDSVSPALEALLWTLGKIKEWQEEQKKSKGINDVFSIFKSPEAYFGEWNDQLDAISRETVQKAYDALSVGVSKKLDVVFADFKDDIEKTGFDFGMLFDLVENRSAEDISWIGKSAGFSQETIDAILAYQKQHDIDVATLAYLDNYLSIKHGNYEEWTEEEENAYHESVQQAYTEAHEAIVKAQEEADALAKQIYDDNQQNLLGLLRTYSDSYNSSQLQETMEWLETMKDTFPEYSDMITEAIAKIDTILNPEEEEIIVETANNIDELLDALGGRSKSYQDSILVAQLEAINEAIRDADDLELWDKAKQLREIKESLEQSLAPITAPEPEQLTSLQQLKELFSTMDNGEFASVGFNAFAEGIDALGQALAGNEDAWASWAKSVLNSISSVIMSHGYEMLAEGTLKLFNTATMAEGLAEVAKSAGVIALGGLVKGLGSRFERGGIVGGSGITGDRHMIFANAGELILNRSQQMAIASQLNQRASGNITVTFNGTVLGDQESISSWVYDGIQRARSNGIV